VPVIIRQDLPLFAKASAFVKTSAGQVGEAGRIFWILLISQFPDEIEKTQSAFGGAVIIYYLIVYLFKSNSLGSVIVVVRLKQSIRKIPCAQISYSFFLLLLLFCWDF
jgi:hypothetical protein